MNTTKGDLVVSRVVLTFFHCVGISSVLFRLRRRKRTSLTWWDDYFAALAFLLNLLYYPTLWFPDYDLDGGKSEHKVIVFTIINSWFFHVVWSLLLWATRISLGLSNTRMMPQRSGSYYASLTLVCTLIATAIAVITVISVNCGKTYSTWSSVPPFQCNAGSVFYIATACLDVISDVLLVVVPMWAFWQGIKLPPTSRSLIKIGFAANTMTALASLITNIVILGNLAKDLTMAIRIISHVLCIISLLACNSLVVVTSVYLKFRTTENEQQIPPYFSQVTPDPPPQSNPPGRSSRHLVTQTTRETNPSCLGDSSSVSNTSETRHSTAKESSLILTVVHTDPSFFSQYNPTSTHQS